MGTKDIVKIDGFESFSNTHLLIIVIFKILVIALKCFVQFGKLKAFFLFTNGKMSWMLTGAGVNKNLLLNVVGTGPLDEDSRYTGLLD